MAQAAPLLWAASLPYCTGWLYRPDLSKFVRVSKIQAAKQIFTISCENSKILSRLLSVLSLQWKFVHDHCCCPNSAIILTDSKMEDILDFGWGCQNLSIILWGGGEGGGERGGERGGAEMAHRPAALVITFEGGAREGGGGKEGRGRTCPCTKCGHMHIVFTPSLLYLRSAVEASLDMKKFHLSFQNKLSSGLLF